MAADLALLWDQASADPVLLYSIAAAVLLAVVSIGSGLARRDFLALARPRTLLRVLGAVAIACLLKVVEVYAVPALPEPVAAVTAGLHRLPLYLVALAYGPVTGAVVGSLFAGFAASASLPGWPEVVLALELAVLGWLAIFPSPRDTRFAGPLNAALAYLLAWGTAGLALHASANEEVTLALLYAEHAAMAPGLVGCVLLLFLFGPAVYERAFPGSRIHSPSRALDGTSAHVAPSGRAAGSVAENGGLAHDVDPFARRVVRDATPPSLTDEATLLHETLATEAARGQQSGKGRNERPSGERRRRLEPRYLPEEFSR